jgi:hypothetical protein
VTLSGFRLSPASPADVIDAALATIGTVPSPCLRQYVEIDL